MRNHFLCLVAVAAMGCTSTSFQASDPSANSAGSSITQNPQCDLKTWYLDGDGDGQGFAEKSLSACTAPAGYVANSDDCLDHDPAVHKGAEEICNGVDDNCDGVTDDATEVWYLDYDGDGHGDPSQKQTGKCTPGDSTFQLVTNSDDCNDHDAVIFKGNAEVCDHKDNDCNGATDEGVMNTYYVDGDGDSYGSTKTTQACEVGLNVVANNTDCDDTKVSVHPGAEEICNGVDDNCVNGADEGKLTTYYKDDDGDGHGNAKVTVQACSVPVGWVATSDDCDDTKPNVHPGATEVCNGIDDNCTGGIDEIGYCMKCQDGTVIDKMSSDFVEMWVDEDNDGYGDDQKGQNGFCKGELPTQNWSLITGDCDDSNAKVHPGAAEVCDGLDNGCTGVVKEADSLCDDSNDYTTDFCEGTKLCVNVPEKLMFVCSKQGGSEWPSDSACGFDAYYESGAYPSVSTNLPQQTQISLDLEPICDKLQLLKTMLGVNGFMMLADQASMKWFGGIMVSVSKVTAVTSTTSTTTALTGTDGGWTKYENTFDTYFTAAQLGCK